MESIATRSSADAATTMVSIGPKYSIPHIYSSAARATGRDSVRALVDVAYVAGARDKISAVVVRGR